MLTLSRCKTTRIFSLVTIFFLLCCSEEKTTDILTKYTVMDSLLVSTTNFRKGEDIFFEFLVVNNTGITQRCLTIDSRPIAFVEVYTGDSLFGSSVDGYGFRQSVVYYDLFDGDTLVINGSWLENSEHDSLPLGYYSSWVKPQLWFDEFGNLTDEKIDITISN